MIFKQVIELFFPTIFDDKKQIKSPGGVLETKNKTIDEIVNFNKSLDTFQLIGKPKHFVETLAWPPNTFLILYYLLDYTDKYRRIVSPIENSPWTLHLLKNAEVVSEDWIDTLNEALTVRMLSEFKDKGNFALNQTPHRVLLGKDIKESISYVFKAENIDKCVYDLFEDGEFTNRVFILISAIDMMFDSYNYIETPFKDLDVITKIVSLKSAARRTTETDNSQSFIMSFSDNKTKTGFVTLKSCVPQNGLTINNLTQNLTYIKPSVKPIIITSASDPSSIDDYNILILPWPLIVNSSYFKESSGNGDDIYMDGRFSFFDYKPCKDFDASLYLKAIIGAIERVGTVDLIVFPECSMSVEEYKEIMSITYDCFEEKTPNILAGVYGEQDKGGRNEALLSFIDDNQEHVYVSQSKHHRWYLDRNQIINYNLSGVLPPHKKYWEKIDISRRKLLTLHTVNNIQLCPLICEDLARQEPVAQAVRSVGPHLVVALLLDGPQLKFRWPGKYAAVLSDDPGSSVLSVTALGMSRRSTGFGDPPSNVIGLWSDVDNGSQELKMSDGGIGYVLTAKVTNVPMWSIDGRGKIKQGLSKEYTGTIFENCDTLNEVEGEVTLETLVSTLKGMSK
ncbi:hypothetical protein LIA67_002749 [Vibrio fluvialis]|uniref:hypothetical protein n=1 Tax=Vibrio fluvialis TaxID=676 RepID=UPI0013031805|nr:hypothetical protein [Vibrio fluvialis]EKO3505156.1 hypothetical protein [Vibrio fluvialis]